MVSKKKSRNGFMLALSNPFVTRHMWLLPHLDVLRYITKLFWKFQIQFIIFIEIVIEVSKNVIVCELELICMAKCH